MLEQYRSQPTEYFAHEESPMREALDPKSEIETAGDILLGLQTRMQTEPGTALTQIEASTLYEVYENPNTNEKDYDTRAAILAQQLRQARSPEADYPQVRSLIKERLLSERYVVESYQAFTQVVGNLELGADFCTPAKFMMGLKEKVMNWDADGVIDHMAAELMAKQTRYNVVPTPNVVASKEQIISLATTFGEDQPYETFVYDELYSRYTGEELSGKLAQDTPVRFSLVPNNYTPEMDSKTVIEQGDELKAMQKKSPKLNLHVPSVLDAAVHWFALRAHGDKLDNSDVWKRTYIRHFDLDPKTIDELDEFAIVPDSNVDDLGRPYLGDSGVGYQGGARVAVG